MPKAFIDHLVKSLCEKAKGYNNIQSLAEEIILEGYDTQALLTNLLEAFIVVEDTRAINDMQKAKIAEVIAGSDMQMISGGDEELNLLNSLS